MGRFISTENVTSFRTSGGPKQRRPLTPVWPASKTPTWYAPASDPHGRTRPEHWDLYSRDGLWHYERYENGPRTSWRVVYLPTGQVREGYTGKTAALEATADRLVDQLRGEAFTLALRSRLDDPRRPLGHRWLAIHLRVAGVLAGAEAKHRCVCGGFLATVTTDGDLAHIDACDRCYRYGKTLPRDLCAHADRHRFCGDPAPAGWQNGCGLWQEFCCPGNCRPD